jgi:hypothetical protein
MSNVAYYTKHFFLKTSFGHLVLLFMFISIFNIYFFSQIYWPKILTWVQNTTTTTSMDASSESLVEDEL